MKKKTKKATKKYTGPTILDRLPNDEGEWLELCIKFTKRAIHDPPRESEKYLLNQVDRLQKKIEEFKNGR